MTKPEPPNPAEDRPRPSAARARRLRCLLVSILSCLAGSSASAQMLTLGGPGSSDLLDLRSTWFPGVHASPSITDTTLRGTIPLARTDTDSWTASLLAGDVHLGEALRLSPSGQAVPRDLWTVDASVTYARRLEAARALGLTLGVGAVSDEPFHSINETAINASATYRTPASGRNEWLWGLNFSNNRPVLNYVPLPIIAYFYRYPEQGLEGSVGFPFALLRWRLDRGWDLFLAAIGPTNVTAEVGFRPARPVRLSGGFYWGQQLWALAGRADTSTRLFHDAKKAAARVELPLFHPLALELSGGYAFDRSFFVGKSVFNRDDRAPLDAGWFAALSLKIFPVGPPRAAPGGK